MTGQARLACWLLAAGLGVLTLACAPSAPGQADSPGPAPAAKTEPAPLAEARLPGSPLTLQITGVTRSGPEVLEVAFALVNAGAAAAPPPRGAPGAGPGHDEWLAASYLIDEERQKRFYVMRDAGGRPAVAPGPAEIAPRGRQIASARFPAPGPEDGRITVVVPGLAPFRGIPFPGTAATGKSY